MLRLYGFDLYGQKILITFVQVLKTTLLLMTPTVRYYTGAVFSLFYIGMLDDIHYHHARVVSKE